MERAQAKGRSEGLGHALGRGSAAKRATKQDGTEAVDVVLWRVQGVLWWASLALSLLVNIAGEWAVRTV